MYELEPLRCPYYGRDEDHPLYQGLLARDRWKNSTAARIMERCSIAAAAGSKRRHRGRAGL
jgi:hypothetical protein